MSPLHRLTSVKHKDKTACWAYNSFDEKQI